MWRHRSLSFLKVEQEQEWLSPRSTCQGVEGAESVTPISQLSMLPVLMTGDVECMHAFPQIIICSQA